MTAVIPACEAPLEEDSQAFRSLDAQYAEDDAEDDAEGDAEDDDDQPHGGPNDLCPDCGDYWMAGPDHVNIYLTEAMGKRIMAQSDQATLFFDSGSNRVMRIGVQVDFVSEPYERFIIRLPRYAKGPPIPQASYPAPALDEDVAVLRSHDEQFSVDVQLQRFEGVDGCVTDTGCKPQ